MPGNFVAQEIPQMIRRQGGATRARAEAPAKTTTRTTTSDDGGHVAWATKGKRITRDEAVLP